MRCLSVPPILSGGSHSRRIAKAAQDTLSLPERAITDLTGLSAWVDRDYSARET
jgi:hypothetical protein